MNKIIAAAMIASMVSSHGAYAAKYVVKQATQEVPRAVAWFDASGEYHITYKDKREGGTPLVPEYMVFAPTDKTTGPAGGGIVMTLQDTPVKQVMSFGSGFSGSMWGRYANIRVDLSEVQAPTNPNYSKGFQLFEQVTQSGTQLCSIALKFAHHKNLTISSNYQIYYDGRQSIDPKGPFVTFRLNLKSLSDSNYFLILLRNGKHVLKEALTHFADGNGFQIFSAHSSNDVLTSIVKDTAGAMIKTGQMGFPVVGAMPDTMEYTLDL